MEGPIDFDLWGTIKASNKQEAIDWFIVSRSISRLDATKLVLEAISANDYIQIYTECGWDDIQYLVKTMPMFVESYAITESTYKPSDRLFFCNEHQLFYARKEGCPVCDNYFIRKVEDGVKRV